MRKSKGGATRSSLDNKPELFKYLSPLVLKRYGEYSNDWLNIAWVAGLFEGEGWIGKYKTTGRIKKDGTKSRPEGYIYPQLGMSLTDEDTIRRFQSIVGGNITGPYLNKKHPTYKPIWYWKMNNKEAMALTVILYPFMGQRRKSKIMEVCGNNLKFYESSSIFSPLVLKAYGNYMLRHQIQEDGQRRDGDNWKKGWKDKDWNDSLPDSKFRHFIDEWLIHDGYPLEARDSEEEALCAQMFGTMARLHNILHKKYEDRSNKL